MQRARARFVYPPPIAAPTLTHARLLAGACCLVAALWLATAWRQEHRLTQAQDALSAGRPQEAGQLAAAVSGSMVDSRARRVQAGAALLTGDLRGAERGVRDALRSAPNDWSLHRDHAVLLLRLGQRARAKSAMRTALTLNPRLVLPLGFERPASETVLP